MLTLVQIKGQKCSTCKETKPLGQFHKDQDRTSGHNAHCKPCRIEYANAYKANNPDSLKNSALKSKYGITLEEYNGLFEKQQGSCACCGKHQMQLNKMLCVDHCHMTGKVRGLLCHKCNSGIGMLGDCLEAVEKVYNYLKGQ